MFLPNLVQIGLTGSICHSKFNFRFEPVATSGGFVRYHNDPALFFLGAPSTFSPVTQAAQLRHLVQEARTSREYLGVRHMAVGQNMLQREERAELRNGTILTLTSSWIQEPSTEKRNVDVQTD